ncbi:hypothetical protein NPIL_372151 [Nephila pilipes]|uniref:Uncharacterized protein n=1 Tax=Nephila pilipes TaxID=299642 RepID=A0A8X6TCD6_NEPPI|nr:hypothetical protein NPIL_372151 [Nephila pilipes]
MQPKKVCDTRRLLEQRLNILRAQHDEAYAYLCHIEEKFQDTTSEFYQGAQAMYKSAEQARTKAEGECDSFPDCPIPGCPYHTKLPKSPNKNRKQKRTDEEGYITPPSRKQAKKIIFRTTHPQITETNNKFKKLQINAQEISENSQHEEITEEPVPQLKEKLPLPMLPTTPNRWSTTTLRSLNKLRPINTTTISLTRIKPEILI